MGDHALCAAPDNPFSTGIIQSTPFTEPLMNCLQAGNQAKDVQIGVKLADCAADLIQIVVTVEGHRHKDRTAIPQSVQTDSRGN